ncbi:PKD domain-containing protein [Glutamicibacter sp. MNS18]|uniref:PKD domain-containing protein n=1 Tax=Glutamicibacter sp. MNS18 TaxID=2989817 RepID=UPI002236758B|nr:PKD domain-containing protein [Glutamicibacter sp. MNS18]MCW4466160.1 PKD domain-containing protein [Glutamicibacter sp. MNS18]
MRFRRFLAALAGFAMVLGLTGINAQAAFAAEQHYDTVVSTTPRNNTPHVLDGIVFAIAEVGDTIVLGGSFTQVQAASGGPVLTRNRLVAFNKNTGAISTSFAPNLNSTVRAVVPAANGTSVYIGGQYGTLNGQSAPKVMQLNLSNGQRVSQFNPGFVNAVVHDINLVGNRLFFGGEFSTVGGQQRLGLAEVNATTGALSANTTVAFEGTHRGGNTFVHKFDVDAAGEKLVATGNFRTIDGQDRVQVGMLDISGGQTTVADWQTNRWTPNCYPSFAYYLNDLDFAPDGSYFVLSSMGGYGSGPPTLCDTISRWQSDHSGSGVNPVWVDYTGGDSVYAVEATGDTVYFGGHMRWVNNPFRADAAGQGAVEREGIGALSATNGMPIAWNPGRDRGRGVFDLLATSDGLWVGSDTDRIARYIYKGRIALFPLAGGSEIPHSEPPGLPVDVLQAGGDTALDERYLYRINTGGDTIGAQDGGIDWMGDINPPGSTYRSTGNNAAGYDLVPNVHSSVPESTPRAIYSSERWDPAGGPQMAYNFPVQSGKNVEVRVYLADRCDCTVAPGSRVYHLDIEGERAFSNIDLNANPGHNIGTVYTKQVVSDGNISLSFDHVVENPAVNGIEIVDLDAEAPDPGEANQAQEIYFNGTVAGSKGVTDLAGTVAWDDVKGGFVANGKMYLAMSNGTFVSRPFNGSTIGAPTELNLYGLSNFATEIGNMTGLFFKHDRIYFTLNGQNQLFMRYLDLDSSIVGAERFTVATMGSGISWNNVRGMFLAEDTLYLANAAGELLAADWTQTVTDGTASGPTQVVSSPAEHGVNWSANALISMDSDGAPPLPNQPPTADIDAQCTDLDCVFDAAGSTDDNEIVSYDWDFGDGNTATGVEVEHSYAATGQYQVTLTVTDDDGASASTSTTVNVTAPPNQAPTAVITSSCDQLECTFSGADSGDPDGEIVSWTWTTSDGGSGDGVDFSHEFATEGTYTVLLTVTDDEGESHTTEEDIEVSLTPNTPPEAAISQVCNELECTFNGGGSVDQEGEIVSYAWSTSDGGSGDAVEFIHQFPAAGTYQVSLTVTDEAGATDTAETEVTVSPTPNQVPVATFTQDCTFLSCTFDAKDAEDPDGEIVSYIWSIGNDQIGEGMVTTYAFDASGTYQVTLTVSDDSGDSASETVPVTVNEDPGPEPGNNVSFVTSAANSGTVTASNHSVSIPSSVQEGDLMIAVLSTNNGSTSLTAPNGWDTRADASTNGMNGAIYSKVATASDAGSTVTVSSSDFVRGSLVLSVYRDATVDAASFAMQSETSSGSEHTTPVLNAQANSWLVSYWADKTANTSTWQLPSGKVARETGAGTGAGHLSWMLADSNGSVSAGDAGGVVATANSASANAVMATVVLAGAPGSGGGPNAAPNAAFDWDCVFLACIFDGTDSSDPEGSLLEYAWSVNGTDMAVGEIFSHGFTEAGTYEVTLTVTDPEGASDSQSYSVTVEEDEGPPPVSDVDFVASAANAGTTNALNHSVQLPSGVQEGDVLVAVLTTNLFNSGASVPAGWEARANVSTASMEGYMFSKVATAADAGSNVTVSLNGYARASLTVSVYRNAAVTAASFVMETPAGASNQHVTPDAEAVAGSWVLSYWGDKTAATSSWSVPSSLDVRQTGAGTGAGHLSWMMADSGGPVSAGTVGGVTGTADSSTANAVMGTVVLGAAD